MWDLSSPTGIKLAPLALEARSLNRWTATREAPRVTILGFANFITLSRASAHRKQAWAPARFSISYSMQCHVQQRKEVKKGKQGCGEEGRSRQSPHPGQFLAGLLGQGYPVAWPWSPSKQGCCQNSSCPPLFRSPWDLHGYEAGHGGLETVKDVASGERHEVVHEGCQGEDE